MREHEQKIIRATELRRERLRRGIHNLGQALRPAASQTRFGEPVFFTGIEFPQGLARTTVHNPLDLTEQAVQLGYMTAESAVFQPQPDGSCHQIKLRAIDPIITHRYKRPRQHDIFIDVDTEARIRRLAGEEIQDWVARAIALRLRFEGMGLQYVGKDGPKDLTMDFLREVVAGCMFTPTLLKPSLQPESIHINNGVPRGMVRVD